VIADRFGYFDNGYHFWPSLIRAGEFFGLDPANPVYKVRNRTGGFCEICRVHSTDDRYFPCDVFQARAREIEAAGYPATHCGWCGDAMPVREGQIASRCWKCETPKQEPRHRHGYIDDGHGCVEKVPAWTVEGRFA